MIYIMSWARPSTGWAVVAANVVAATLLQQTTPKFYQRSQVLFQKSPIVYQHVCYVEIISQIWCMSFYGSCVWRSTEWVLVTAKETYILSKETYIHSKKSSSLPTCIQQWFCFMCLIYLSLQMSCVSRSTEWVVDTAKETYVLSKEPYIHSKKSNSLLTCVQQWFYFHVSDIRALPDVLCLTLYRMSTCYSKRDLYSIKRAHVARIHTPSDYKSAVFYPQITIFYAHSHINNSNLFG